MIRIKNLRELSHQDILSWETLVSSEHFSSLYGSYAWMKLVELSDKREMQLALYYDEADQLVAGLPFYEFTYGSNDYYDPALLLQGFNPFFPEISSHAQSQEGQCINIGLMAATGCEFRYKNENRALAQLAACHEAIQLAHPDKPIYFLYVSEHSRLLRSYLANRDYHELVVGNKYYMANYFSDFDDYLARFSSNFRKHYRREQGQFQQLGYHQKNYSGQEIQADLHAKLCKLNAEKYGFHAFDTVFFAQRTDHMVELFKTNCMQTIVYDKLGQAIASVLKLRYRDGLYADSIGMDYEQVDKKTGLYFNLAFYDSIELMLARPYHFVNFGEYLHDVKLSRGCQFEIVSLFHQGTSQPSLVKQRLESLRNKIDKYKLDSNVCLQ